MQHVCSQVVLDNLQDELLSDFVHIAAFHTSRPLVRVPVGNAAERWLREIEERKAADRARRERRRRERHAHDAAQAAQLLAERAAKVGGARFPTLVPQVAPEAPKAGGSLQEC
jgi:hypothetical protein